jgi:hypothetical protein
MKPIDAPDWVDQDLLTKQDAADRLDVEIGDDQARLTELESSDAHDDSRRSAITLVRRRIAAMTEIRDELRRSVR